MGECMDQERPLSDKRIDLLNALAACTRHGGITWEETEREGTFQTSLPKYSFRISTRPTESGREVIVDLHDQMGQRIERMSQSQFVQCGDPGDRLVRMYESARRQALNVDASIEEALELLKSHPMGN